MNTLTILTAIITCASLTGCAGRDDQDTGNRRSRGLSLWQVGLINVSSGDNTLTSPEPRDTSRLVIDQRLRFDNQLTK